MRPEIVLATRFGPSSAEPARVAASLAHAIGAHITVLYVATELQALQVGGAEAAIDDVLQLDHRASPPRNSGSSVTEPHWPWLAAVSANWRGPRAAICGPFSMPVM